MRTKSTHGDARRLHASETGADTAVRVHFQDAILSPNSEYATLATTPEARAAACRQRLHETLSDDDLKAIRKYRQQQRALGRDDSRAVIEARTRRLAAVRPTYRLPRTNSNGGK